MSHVNKTTVMVGGGGKNVYFHNIIDKKWFEGPKLKNIRLRLACGKGQAMFRNSRRHLIIAAGGLSPWSRWRSTEVLFINPKQIASNVCSNNN